MNEIFNFHGQEVRTVIFENEPWFVAKDVADILGYQNGSRDINRHVDEDDKLTSQVATAGQMRNQTVINESGLYSLTYPANYLKLRSSSAGSHQRSCQLFASKADLSVRTWTRMPLSLYSLVRRNCVSNRLACWKISTTSRVSNRFTQAMLSRY